MLVDASVLMNEPAALVDASVLMNGPAMLVDVSVLMLVLHHHDDPSGVISEAARILVPGGRILLVDMVAHDRNEFADEMGHLHLGFSRETVEAWASASGLRVHGYRRLRPSAEGRGPALFAAILTR